MAGKQSPKNILGKRINKEELNQILDFFGEKDEQQESPLKKQIQNLSTDET